MGVLANLLIRIGANTLDYDKKLSQASGRIKRFGEDVSSIGRKLTFGITAPLTGVGVAALKVAGDMEYASIAFTTMLKSEQAAQKHLEDLKKLALTTPFQFPELVDASKRIMAFGFASEDVIPTLRTIGNLTAAIGGGKEHIDRVTLALGQMKQKGVIQSQEMRQLAEAGIPAWEILAKVLNTDVAGAMKAVEARAVSSATTVPRILAEMDARFGGLMEKQSKTILGLWANLKDKITFTLADIGKVLAPHAKRIMTDFFDPLLAKATSLADGFAKLSPAAQDAALGVGVFVAALPPAIWLVGSMITNFGVLTGALTKVSGALGLGRLALLGWAAAIPIVLVGGKKIYDSFVNIRSAVDDYAEATKDISILETALRQQGLSKEVGALYQEFKRGEISWEQYTRKLYELKKQWQDSHKAVIDLKTGIVEYRNAQAGATPPVTEHTEAVRTMTLQELVRKEAVSRGEAAIRKATDAIVDAHEAGKPWGKQLELHAAQIDDTAFRTALLRGEIERLGQVQAQVAEVDWSKAIKGTWMEAAQIMKNVGVTPQVELQQEVGKLRAAYNRMRDLRDINRASDLDVARVHEALIEAERRAATVTGTIAQKSESSWRKLGNQVSTIQTDLSRGIADLMWEGGKLKDVLVGTFEEAGKAVTRLFIEAGVKKAIASLGDLVGSIGGVGKAINSVFGTSSAVVSGAGAAAGGAANATGAVSGGAGKVASAIGSSVAGWVGAIGSAVSAVSGVIGNFQNARQETTLNAIEESSRYIKNYLRDNIIPDIQQFLPNVKYLNDYMWTVQADYLRQICDAVVWGAYPSGSGRSSVGGGGSTINVGTLVVQGTDARGQAQALVQWLKTMGVRVVGVPV
jgi:tape measure domain-containing protein